MLLCLLVRSRCWAVHVSSVLVYQRGIVLSGLNSKSPVMSFRLSHAETNPRWRRSLSLGGVKSKFWCVPGGKQHGYTACIGVPQYLCHKSMAFVTMASVFSWGIWRRGIKKFNTSASYFCSLRCLFTHIAQKLDHAFGPVDAHQHDLVAQQDLQGHKHQDLTGAADHLVPHPENNERGSVHSTGMKNWSLWWLEQHTEAESLAFKQV